MKTRGLETILQEHPFFKGMSTKHLDILGGCASNVTFDVGEKIFELGSDADKFYIIREGLVAVQIQPQDRGAITIQTLGEGRVLGWSWLFPPYRWSFDAEALAPVRAIALDGKCLREKCDKDPELGYELLKRFCSIVVQRLEATRVQLIDLYGSDVSGGTTF